MKTFKLLFLAVLVSFSTSCSKDDIEDPSTEVETIEFSIGYNSGTSEISVNGSPWQPSADFDTFVSVNNFSAAPGVDFGILHDWDAFTLRIVSDQHELHSIVTNSLLPSYSLNNNVLTVNMPDLRNYFDEVDSIIYFTIRVVAQ
jgi:hypothetical protein